MSSLYFPVLVLSHSCGPDFRILTNPVNFLVILQEGWYDDRPRSFLVYAPSRTAAVYALADDDLEPALSDEAEPVLADEAEPEPVDP